MINILHFIDQYEIGGRGKTVINSAKFIDSKLFKIHIASFVKAKDIRMEFVAVSQALGIPYLALTDSRGISFKNIKALINYLRTHNIHIIHTHDYKTDLIGFFLVKFICLQLILVSTHHGWILNSIRQNVFHKIDLHLSKYFHGIITVSQALFQKLPRRTKQVVNCNVINNAIVLSDYQSQNQRDHIRKLYNIKENQTLIGVIGRLSIEKGCLDMLEAFNILTQEKDNVLLIFIGDGPLLSELQSRVKILNLDHKVIFSGYQSPIQPFYDALDILVCPSHTEGISNVILEAMVIGVPIIATRVGGNPEILEDGKSGLLVAPKKPVILSSRLSTLIDDKQLQLSYVKKAKSIGEEKFNFRERMKKVEHFYMKLIKKNGNTS